MEGSLKCWGRRFITDNYCICFHHYRFLLKEYSRTCGRSCSNTFGIQDLNKAKIKGSDEISLDVAKRCKKIFIHCCWTKTVCHLLKETTRQKRHRRWTVTIQLQHFVRIGGMDCEDAEKIENKKNFKFGFGNA